MSDDQRPDQHATPDADRRPVTQRPVLDYFSAGGQGLVTLRSMSPMEAELASAKLACEGIPSFVMDRNASVMYPLAVPYVRLQVHEADAKLADEILSRRAPPESDGDYADENWRCPRCHRKAVELLPPSRPWRRVRAAFFIILPAPLLAMLILLILPPDSAQAASSAFDRLFVPWIITTAVLGLCLLLARRRKKCRECGFEWDGTRPP